MTMSPARMRIAILIPLIYLISSCDEAKFSKSGERTSPSTTSLVDFVNGYVVANPPPASGEEPPDPSVIQDNYCGGSGDECKVWICHYPPGQIDNRHSVCVSVNALPAHVGRHGSEGEFDFIGPCEEGPVGPGDPPSLPPDHEADGDDHVDHEPVDHEPVDHDPVGHCLPRP